MLYVLSIKKREIPKLVCMVKISKDKIAFQKGGILSNFENQKEIQSDMGSKMLKAIYFEKEETRTFVSSN